MLGLKEEIKNLSKTPGSTTVSANFDVPFAGQSTLVPNLSPQINFERRHGALI